VGLDEILQEKPGGDWGEKEKLERTDESPLRVDDNKSPKRRDDAIKRGGKKKTQKKRTKNG